METAPLESPVRLTAVVVTYHSEASIVNMMNSLKRSHEAGILDCIVVNNNSQDSTLEKLDSFRSWAKIVMNPVNAGYGRGCNVGLKLANTEFVMFINPDATIEPHSIVRLTNFLLDHSRAQLVSPTITEPEGTVQSVGNSTNPWNILRTQIPFLKTSKRRPAHPGDVPFKTDWICGAILVGRTAFLRSLGGFDPRFFLYFEETDLCRRILNSGGELWCVATAEGYHIGAVSSKSLAADMIGDCIAEHYYRSRYYYLCKHFGLSLATFTELTESILLIFKGLVSKILGRKDADVYWQRLRAPFLIWPKKPQD